MDASETTNGMVGNILVTDGAVHVMGVPGAPAVPIAISQVAGENVVAISQTAGANGVTLNAGENHAGAVGGHTFRVKATFTRPNDNNNYAINDVVSNSTVTTTPIRFVDIARETGKGITLAHLRMGINVTGLTQTFRIYLYRDTPASPPVDNAAWANTWANEDLRLGYVDFDTPMSGSDCTDYYGVPVWVGMRPTLMVAKDMYGLLVVKVAWNAPTAQAIFNFYADGFQD